MKRTCAHLIKPIVLILTCTLLSCEKNHEEEPEDNAISIEVLQKIEKLGFSTQNLINLDSGFIVENDIFIPNDELNADHEITEYRIASEEHYRTSRVTGTTPIFPRPRRIIRIYMNPSFSSTYLAALDEAISRYNALSLKLGFQRVNTRPINDLPEISIYTTNQNVLGYAGFPNISRDVYPSIYLNPVAIGGRTQAMIATIIAHEIGHCLGLRHTDYMDRRFSCGIGTPNPNEGNGGVGAIHIPGTPAGPDQASWMLACIGFQNRPFTPNDIVALRALFGTYP